MTLEDRLRLLFGPLIIGGEVLDSFGSYKTKGEGCLFDGCITMVFVLAIAWVVAFVAIVWFIIYTGVMLVEALIQIGRLTARRLRRKSMAGPP